jgi:hypothetical protein
VKKLISAILFTGVILLPLSAQAGPLQQRIGHQEQRIYQGVKNGSISPKEYKQLEQQ